MSTFKRMIYKINKMEYNLELKTSRRKRIKSIKKLYIDELAKHEVTNNLTKQIISADDLAQIKINIRNKLKKKNVQNQVYTITLVVLFIILLITTFYMRFSIEHLF